MKRKQQQATVAGLTLALAATLSPAVAGTYTNGAVADAFVGTGPTGNLSGDNFGAAGALTVEAANLPQGEFQSVIEFNLSAAANSFNAEYGAGQWTIQSMSLELTASSHGNAIFNAVAAGQFGVSLMQNNSWIEGAGTGGVPTTTGITWNGLTGGLINPAADEALGTFNFAGGTGGVANYSLGLAPGLVADAEGGDDLSLRLFPADNQISYLFSSREASPNGPELVINAVPEPDTLALAAVDAALIFGGWMRRRRLVSAPARRSPELDRSDGEN
jgi:hypothetical protein